MNKVKAICAIVVTALLVASAVYYKMGGFPL